MVVSTKWITAALFLFVSTVGATEYGTLECSPDNRKLVLSSEKKLVALGIEPEQVTIERQLCKLSFPSSSCSAYKAHDNLPTKEEIARLAEPKPLVLVVKMGVGSPYAGDRAQILNKLLVEAVANGRVQIVFLVDRSQWTKENEYSDAHEAFPPEIKPIVIGYSVNDIERIFPTKQLKDRDEEPKRVRARASSKYYETVSWSWWWEKHGSRHKDIIRRVWTVEDDTVFTGNWGSLLETLEEGLSGVDARHGAKGADMIAFRDFCTPEKSWIWARYMHEGVANLTYPGKGLETWMTAYGLSPRYLDAVVSAQKTGTTGHIEWFPATFALRHGFGLVFIQHDLRGKTLGRSCSGGGSKRGGTFNYCCQGKNTVDSENWFEGWKRNPSVCPGPTLLHPVKGNACGRFSANGFGEGCWSRKFTKGAQYKDLFNAGVSDPKTSGYYHAYSGSELMRVL